MSLKVYKKGQGSHTRLWSALILAVMVGLGCYKLFLQLEAYEPGPWVLYLVPTILFAVLAFVIFWLVNKPSMADFMIAAEGEMKKVSWSSRQEIIVSTSVVIVVVILMSVLLGVTDLLFSAFFQSIMG